MRASTRGVAFVALSLLVTVALGLLRPAAAVAGIEEHSPVPTPDLQWFERLPFDPLKEAQKAEDVREDDDRDDVEPVRPEPFDLPILHDARWVDEMVLKWELAALGITYLTVEEANEPGDVPDDVTLTHEPAGHGRRDPRRPREATASHGSSGGHDFGSVEGRMGQDGSEAETGCSAAGRGASAPWGLALLLLFGFARRIRRSGA